MSTYEKFTVVYDNVKKTIPFKHEWSTGDGFFGGLLKPGALPLMCAGDCIKSITPGGRRIVVMYTPLGPFIAFDRFRCTPDDPKVISYETTNGMKEVGWFCDPSELKEDDIDFIFGDFSLGRRIDQIYRNIKSTFKNYCQPVR